MFIQPWRVNPRARFKNKCLPFVSFQSMLIFKQYVIKFSDGLLKMFDTCDYNS